MAHNEYKKRRNFAESPEPSGGTSGKIGNGDFVIQMHDASTLHFDFRLAIDGTLKSWAVPKGPSTDPSDKRLAIRTEDHPLEYADFEGVIPQGQYGSGKVLVWDRGRFDNMTEKDGRTIDASTALRNGHLLIRLHGQKISGGYALQRLERGEQERWLLIKMDDDAADARRNPVSTQPASVKSGKRLRELNTDENSSDRKKD